MFEFSNRVHVHQYALCLWESPAQHREYLESLHIQVTPISNATVSQPRNVEQLRDSHPHSKQSDTPLDSWERQ